MAGQGADVPGSRILLPPAAWDRRGRLGCGTLGLAVCGRSGPLDDPGLVSFPGPGPDRDADPGRRRRSVLTGVRVARHVRRDPRSAFTARDGMPVRRARQTEVPAPRQSGKTLSAALAGVRETYVLLMIPVDP
jgi:hypothetical protein